MYTVTLSLVLAVSKVAYSGEWYRDKGSSGFTTLLSSSGQPFQGDSLGLAYLSSVLEAAGIESGILSADFLG